MEDEVPPDGLSERQLIKWFKDAPKRKKERSLRKNSCGKSSKQRKRGKRPNQAAPKDKRREKLNKKKSALRKRNAKKRKREREQREKEERRKNRKPGGFATTEYKISPALQACCGGVSRYLDPKHKANMELHQIE